MRFTLLAVTAFAASASASALFSRQTPPACVAECAAKAPVGDCTDNACLCKNEEFVATTTKCVEETCPADQVEMAKEVSRQLCLQAGVTLSAEAPAPSASEPADPEPSAAPSGSGSGAPPAPSGSASGAAPSGSGKPPAPSGSGSGAPAPSESAGGNNGAMTTGASAAAGILAVAAAALVL